MPSTSHRLLQVRTAGGVTTAKVLVKRITIENADTFGEQAVGLLDGACAPRVLLDLEKVEIVTGAALGQIVSLYRRVRDRGGHLVVANTAPWVEEVFRVTYLDRMLDVRPRPAATK